VTASIVVRRFDPTDEMEWRRLRHALWPYTTDVDHARDLREYAESPHTHVILVAARPGGGLAGCAEVRLRSHADECFTSPVAFLEGWYVDVDVRRRGVGRSLVAAAEAWARERGCREFGSDAHVENTGSRAAHRALGFEESTPVVNFRKVL
jgi:aminoglycoside 6'-N-acetyltransferase I